MCVTPATAAAAWEYEGTTYYFCSVGCIERFKATPRTSSRPGASLARGKPTGVGPTGVSMYGYATKKDDLQSRLRKIEGQVRGLQRMVDEDKYCIDILTQVNSVTARCGPSAWGSWTTTCGTASRESIATGEGDEKMEELMAAVGRFAGK